MRKKIQFLRSSATGITFVSTSLLLILTFTFTACNNKQPKDTAEVAEDYNEAKFDESKEDDSEFLVSAAAMNLEEIQLGQLAQTKSQNPLVVNLGKLMEDKHKQALSDLQELAAKKQITIPSTLSDSGKEANKSLMDKEGKDFDEEYCDRMVSTHKDAIDKFEEMSKDANDPDIRTWAASMVPEMRAHLERSISCQEQVGNME
jgi:putative membrane protein